jgi:hypothetical protein
MKGDFMVTTFRWVRWIEDGRIRMTFLRDPGVRTATHEEASWRVLHGVEVDLNGLPTNGVQVIACENVLDQAPMVLDLTLGRLVSPEEETAGSKLIKAERLRYRRLGCGSQRGEGWALRIHGTPDGSISHRVTMAPPPEVEQAVATEMVQMVGRLRERFPDYDFGCEAL